MAQLPPYSTRFVAFYGAANTYRYVVPEGYRAVLVCVDHVSTTPGVLSRLTVALGSLAYIWESEIIADIGWAQWTGRQVLEAGEELQLRAQTPCSAVASGYLLNAVP